MEKVIWCKPDCAESTPFTVQLSFVLINGKHGIKRGLKIFEGLDNADNAWLEKIEEYLNYDC